MKKTKFKIAALIVVGTLLALFGMQTLNAQQTGFKRVELQKQDLSAHGREAVVAAVEFSPGAVAGKHTHPGEELGYVLDGTLVLEVDGRPPMTLKAGDVYFIDAGRVHDGKNLGSTPAKVLVTYVVEKGKPVATSVK